MMSFVNKHPYLFTFFVLPALVAVPVLIFGNPKNVNPEPQPAPRPLPSVDDFLPNQTQLSGMGEVGYDSYDEGY